MKCPDDRSTSDPMASPFGQVWERCKARRWFPQILLPRTCGCPYLRQDRCFDYIEVSVRPEENRQDWKPIICDSGRLVIRNRRGYGMWGIAPAMIRGKSHRISGFSHSSSPSMTMSLWGVSADPCSFRTSNDLISSSWTWYIFVNTSQFSWILLSTKGPSSLKLPINCEMRVGISWLPSFLDESALKKKKLAARCYLFWRLTVQVQISRPQPRPSARRGSLYLRQHRRWSSPRLFELSLSG